MSLQQYVIHLADNSLIYSQRLSEWCGHGPALEVDIALSNFALDHIGAARSFYQYAAQLIGEPTTEDSLAFLRKEREFRNIIMVELPNGDFAKTMAKALCLDQFLLLFYTELLHSADKQLAAIAEKSLKEVNYHLRFSTDWTIRLGDGTPESKVRMQKAIDEIWQYTGEMFMPNEIDKQMQQQMIAPRLEPIKEKWHQAMEAILEEATLKTPETGWMHSGGKNGIHSEQFGFLIAELQYMQRAYPDAKW